MHLNPVVVAVLGNLERHVYHYKRVVSQNTRHLLILQKLNRRLTYA